MCGGGGGNQEQAREDADERHEENLALQREQMAEQAASLASEDMQLRSHDFQTALAELKEKENSKWRHLRELSGEQPYPVLLSGTVDSFRSEVRSSFTPLLRQTLPSLAETDKPDPDTV